MGGLRRQEGFTLVEVLVAALILVTGILAVLGVFASSQKGVASATRAETAINQGERHLEWMRTFSYAGLAMCEPPSHEEAPSPNSRVQGNMLEVADGKTERIVVAEPGEMCVPTEPRSFKVGEGAAAVTGEIYYYVTWRNEECPIVDLGELGTQVDDLISQIAAITTGLDGALTALGPVSTSLQSLLNQANSALNYINNQWGSWSSGIRDRVGPLRNALPGVQTSVGDTLTSLQGTVTALNGLQAQLLDVSQTLQNLSLTGIIDLCNLPESLLGLPDIAGLLEGSGLAGIVDAVNSLELDLNDVPGSLNTIRNSISSGIQSIQGLVSQLLGLTCSLPLVGALCNALLNDIVNAVNGVLNALGGSGSNPSLDDTLGQVQDPLGSLQGISGQINDRIGSLNSLAEALGDIVAGSGTDENTKRISVAITIDGDRPDLAPQTPVWIQSVVVDQTAGLL